MNISIKTQFVVASVPGIDTLLYLTQTIAREKFLPLLPADVVKNYIAKHFNEKTLLDEVNSLSNQWVVVYLNGSPAGFARVTAKGARPAALSKMRVIGIADFGILNAHAGSNVDPDHGLRKALFDKCMSVCRSYEAVWLNEYLQNPYLNFFESEGFVRQAETSELPELSLKSVYLVKKQS